MAHRVPLEMVGVAGKQCPVKHQLKGREITGGTP